MFESVFGYDPKFLPEKQRHEEVKGANLPAQALRTPYVAAAYDDTLLGGMVQQRDQDLPEVVLDEVERTIRAPEN